MYRGLRITSGTFSSGNNVTLKSNATRTAYLYELGNNGVGASIAGDLICELHMSTLSSQDYRNIVTPIQGATISDLQDGVSPDGIYTYGFPGSNLPSASGYISVYSYNSDSATATGNEADGWQPPINASELVSPYYGHTCYMGGTSGSASKTSYDLRVSGVPYTGTINMNTSNSAISSTSAGVQTWGFIGNPYPSAIDWNNVSLNNVNSEAQVWGVDDNPAGYRSTLANNGNRIAPFQGFWVQTTGASPSITFEEEDKITNEIDFRKSKPLDNRFYFELHEPNGKYVVAAEIEINDQASKGYDRGIDGIVFENTWPIPNLYMPIEDSLNGQVYGIDISENQQIPIVVKAPLGRGGFYKLKFTHFPNQELCVFLHDLENDSLINIYRDSSYSFFLSDKEELPRFYLHLRKALKNEPLVTHVECSGDQNGMLEFELENPKEFSPRLFDPSGQQVSLIEQKGSVFIAEKLGVGNYSLKVSHQLDLCPESVRTISIFEPERVTSNFDVQGELYPHESIQLKNLSTGANEFMWFVNEIFESDDYDFQKVFAKAGVYQLSLISSNGNDNCNDTLNKSLKVFELSSTNEEESNLSSNVWIHVESGSIHMTLNQNYPVQDVQVKDILGKSIIAPLATLPTSAIIASDIPSGIYLITWREADTIFERKLMVR